MESSKHWELRGCVHMFIGLRKITASANPNQTYPLLSLQSPANQNHMGTNPHPSFLLSDILENVFPVGM